MTIKELIKSFEGKSKKQIMKSILDEKREVEKLAGIRGKMSKEIDLIKCIIYEIDKNLYSDFGGNLCISYTPDLKKLLLALNTSEVRYYFNNFDNKDQQIAELKKQLADKQKEFDEFKRIGEKGHLNDLLEDKREENRLLIKGYEQLKQRFTDKEKEVQDLKEQLKSQPAEIVEKIKKEFQKHLFDWYEDGKNINNELYIDADWVWEVLDTFLKQYQK